MSLIEQCELGEVRAAGFTVLAMTPAPDAVPMDASDVRVVIPMRRGVDSLNVAAATAVACWELGRDDPL